MSERIQKPSRRDLLLPFDVGACAAVFAGALALSEGGAGEDWRLVVLGFVAAGAMPLCVWTLSARPTRGGGHRMFTDQLLPGAALGAAAVGAAAFALRPGIQPGTVFASLGAQALVLGLARGVAVVGLRWLRRRGANRHHVLVIGTGPRAVDFAATVARHPEWGLHLLGHLDEGDTPVDDRIPADRVFKMASFPEILAEQVVDEVVVACPRSMLTSLEAVVRACSAAGVPLTLMNDLFGDYLPQPRATQFGSRGALTFAPVQHDAVQRAAKRVVDVLASATGLLVCAPLLLLAAAAVQLVAPGRVFVGEERRGRNGRPFVLWRLRTGPRDGAPSTAGRRGRGVRSLEPARSDRLGRILRRLAIDQIPVLWSVLRGDMSLVGPRPTLPEDAASYKTWQRRCLSVRPGLTCWQAQGFEPADADEWARLDLEYIDTWSLGGDLRLILQTVAVAMGGGGR